VYFKFFFVYSEGTNEGDINYIQREGYLFKTYEGKMIQTGYKSNAESGSIQSNEFKFSVVDERVAEQIDAHSSRQVKLHWKRYLGTLPWRGNSMFVVDSIISVRQELLPQNSDEEEPLQGAPL
jgi:type IV secretory pathway VirD2 relaxase